MKRILLLTMLFFVVALVHAQKAKFGLKVGVALPNNVGSDTESDSATTGLDYSPTISGGFYINSKVGEYFWIKHEVIYVNRGYNEGGTNNFRVNQHYLDVYPVNFTFHFKGAQLMVGPSISFLAIKTHESLNSANEIVVDRSDLEEEGRNLAEIGIVAGLDYEFPFGLNLGARYVRGLTSQYQLIKDQPQIKVFSQALLFSVGYTFGANKKPASANFD